MSYNKKTHQWDIVHAKNDNSLVLRCIFSDPTQMCLQDMVAIQKGHFTIRLDPDLFFKMPLELSMYKSTLRKNYAPYTWHTEQGNPTK